MSNRNEKKSDAIRFGWWYGRVEQMSKAFRSMMEKMRDRYPSFEYKQGEPCIMANLVMLEDGKVRINDRRVVIKTVKEHLGDNANRSGFVEP